MGSTINRMGKRMKKGLLEDKKIILENVYLAVFAMFCLYFFMWTTTFHIVWPEFFVGDIRSVMIALILLRFSLERKKYEWMDLFSVFFLIVVFLAVKNRNGQEILLDTLILIIGAKGIETAKMLRVYMVTIGTALVVTMGASLAGVIENLTYEQPGRMARMAFGIGYPTDFGAHVFFPVSYTHLRAHET